MRFELGIEWWGHEMAPAPYFMLYLNDHEHWVWLAWWDA